MNIPNDPSVTSDGEQLTQQLVAAHTTIDQLSAALRSNRDIGAAVGILMAQRRVTRKRAFDLLRQASQHLNLKMREVALDVIDTGTLPETFESPPAASKPPSPKPPLRRRPGIQQCHALGGRVAAALRNADLRDAAAAVRSAASRARGIAAEARHEAAKQREAAADSTGTASDRRCELDDRHAEAIDNIWTARDSDAAASDRALLLEASHPPGSE